MLKRKVIEKMKYWVTTHETQRLQVVYEVEADNEKEARSAEREYVESELIKRIDEKVVEVRKQ